MAEENQLINYCLLVGQCSKFLGMTNDDYRVYEFMPIIKGRYVSPMRVITRVILSEGKDYKMRGNLDTIYFNRKNIPVLSAKYLTKLEGRRIRDNEHLTLIERQLKYSFVYLDKLKVISIEQFANRTCVRFHREQFLDNNYIVLNFFSFSGSLSQEKVDELKVGSEVSGLFVIHRNTDYDSTPSLDEIGMRIIDLNPTEETLTVLQNNVDYWGLKKKILNNIG